MEYELTRVTLDNTHAVPLSAEQFRAIRAARERAMSALGVEEKYNLVLGNYEELKGEMLRLTLQHALYLDFHWSSMVGEAHVLNRRLVNLLSTGRLYLDHVRHTISSLYGKASGQLSALAARTSEEYDSRLGYRVMEALRNHVQHRELPIAEISFTDGGRDLESAVKELSIRLDPVKLRHDENMKSSILTELEAAPENCEIKPLVRDYVTGIGRVHAGARDLIAADIAASEALIREMIALYKSRAPEGTFSVLGLYAIAYEGDKLVERVPVFDDPIRRRAWLVKRNSAGTHKLRFIVTSK